jgi:hypothetical protein
MMMSSWLFRIPYMEVSENRGTHSSHPYIDMIFHYKASSYCGIPIVGNPQILAQQNPSTSFSYINLILLIIFHQCLILKKHKFSCTTNSSTHMYHMIFGRGSARMVLDEWTYKKPWTGCCMRLGAWSMDMVIY